MLALTLRVVIELQFELVLEALAFQLDRCKIPGFLEIERAVFFLRAIDEFLGAKIDVRLGDFHAATELPLLLAKLRRLQLGRVTIEPCFFGEPGGVETVPAGGVAIRTNGSGACLSARPGRSWRGPRVARVGNTCC